MAASLTPAQKFMEVIVGEKGILNLAKLICEETKKSGHNLLEPTLLAAAANGIKALSDNQMITNFIEKTHMHWDDIHKKDIKVFVEKADAIFVMPNTGAKYGGIFITFFTKVDSKGEQVVSEAYRDKIWKYFHAMIGQCIDHIHMVKQPRLEILPDGTKKAKYLSSEFNYIKIVKTAQQWNRNLAFTIPL